MGLIEFFLDGATTVGFAEGFYHGFGEIVGIENDFTVGVSGSTTNDLDEGSRGTEEAFFICVEDGDERHFGEVDSFTEEVYSHDNVDDPGLQLFNNFSSVHRRYLTMEVEGFVSLGYEEIGHLFGGFFGEGEEKDFPFFRDMFVELFEEMRKEGV